MSKIVRGISFLTVSRPDIYDYLRCPKIVSIKVYKRTRTPKPERVASERTERGTALIGKIGEAATHLAFSPEPEIYSRSLGSVGKEIVSGETTKGLPTDSLGAIIVRSLRSQIQQLPKNLETDLKRVVKETFEGIDEIRRDIKEAYGDVTVIGKGESRYETLPTMGYPDFVAFTSGKPILIEVKNTTRENQNLDGFQASFYNSLGQTVGVVIQDFGIGSGVVESSPRMVLEQDAKTLIVYPRLKTWRSVDDTVDLSPKVVKDVWRAKQLGLLGKSPKTNCPSDCPHYKFDIDLPEGSLETAKPLPLIFAKGLAELGVDFDYEYLESHLWRISPSLSDALWRIRFGEDRVPKEQREELRHILQDRFDLDDSTVRKLVPETGKAKDERYPTYKEVLKEEASEIEPWEKLLPKKILKDVSQTSLSRASKLYKLPKESSRVIRKAWKKW